VALGREEIESVEIAAEPSFRVSHGPSKRVRGDAGAIRTEWQVRVAGAVNNGSALIVTDLRLVR